MSEDTYESCDLSVDPLFEWGLPSVDNSVLIQGLVPGEYFFICAVAGHCDAGMKVKVSPLYTPTLLEIFVLVQTFTLRIKQPLHTIGLLWIDSGSSNIYT